MTDQLAVLAPFGISLALGALMGIEMFARVILEVAVVHRPLLAFVAAPVGVAMVAGVGGAGLLYLRARASEPPPNVPYRNPFSLGSAFKFGVLFVAILFVVKLAQLQFPAAGVLVAAALAGTVDVDAMTLTMANLASEGEVAPATAAWAICITVASNTVVNAGMAATLGAPALKRALIPIVLATLGAGAAVLVFAR